MRRRSSPPVPCPLFAPAAAAAAAAPCCPRRSLLPPMPLLLLKLLTLVLLPCVYLCVCMCRPASWQTSATITSSRTPRAPASSTCPPASCEAAPGVISRRCGHNASRLQETIRCLIALSFALPPCHPLHWVSQRLLRPCQSGGAARCHTLAHCLRSSCLALLSSPAFSLFVVWDCFSSPARLASQHCIVSERSSARETKGRRRTAPHGTSGSGGRG